MAIFLLLLGAAVITAITFCSAAFSGNRYERQERVEEIIRKRAEIARG